LGFVASFVLFLLIIFTLRQVPIMLGLSAFIPRDPFYQLTIALCFVGILVATVFVYALRPKSKGQPVGTVEAYLKFIYGCFLKPHTGDGSGSQQDALVSYGIEIRAT
jgi:betaine lipid synthase